MYSNEGSMSTWGIFLFLLILFAVFGGNRCGGGLFGGWGGNCGCGVVPGALAYGEGQTDRDVLKLETAMVSAMPCPLPSLRPASARSSTTRTRTLPKS